MNLNNLVKQNIWKLVAVAFIVLLAFSFVGGSFSWIYNTGGGGIYGVTRLMYIVIVFLGWAFVLDKFDK